MLGHKVSNNLNLLVHTSNKVGVFSKNMKDYFFTYLPAKRCLTFAMTASLCLGEAKKEFLPSQLFF